jgi:hypothetical protein
MAVGFERLDLAGLVREPLRILGVAARDHRIERGADTAQSPPCCAVLLDQQPVFGAVTDQLGHRLVNGGLPRVQRAPAMHRAAVIPDHEIANLPFMAVDEFRPGCGSVRSYNILYVIPLLLGAQVVFPPPQPRL